MPWVNGSWLPDEIYYREDPRSAVVGLAGRRTPSPSVRRQQDAYGALRETQTYSTRNKIGNAIMELLTLGRHDSRPGGPNLGAQGGLGGQGIIQQAGMTQGQPSGAGYFRDSPPAQFARDFVQAGLGPANQPGNAMSNPGFGNPFRTEVPKTIDLGPKTSDRLDRIDRLIRGDELNERRSSSAYESSPGASARQTAFSNALERFRQQEWQPYQDQIDELKNDYLDRINQLQQELEGYQGGLAGTNAAYGDYAEDANAILSEAAAVQGEPIPDGTTQPIADAYDNINGVMADTINRIGATGNPALAQEMANQIGYMQETITDAMAGNLMRQDELFDLASSQAQALAHMAWKDDLYNAERARTELEIEINQAIGDKQDEIDDARAQMADAIRKIRESYDPQEFSPNEVWALGMDNYLDQMGLDPFQKERAMQMWAQIVDENPQAMYDFATFKGDLYVSLNEQNLMRAGLWDDITQFFGGGYDDMLMGTGLDEVQINNMKDQLENSLASSDIVRAIQGVNPAIAPLFNMLNNAGFVDLSKIMDSTIQFDTFDSPHFSALVNVWSERQNFEANYDSYTHVDADMMPGSVSYSSDGEYAYPIAGQSWWSGGGFGYMDSDGRHEGLDFHAYHGTPIVAAASGWVEEATRNDVGGWFVRVRDSQGYLHYYAHMDGPATVQKGDYVNVGRMIGRVGSSGNARGGPAHLHYGVRDRSGRAVDPTAQMRAVNAAAGTRSPSEVYDPANRWQPVATSSQQNPTVRAV